MSENKIRVNFLIPLSVYKQLSKASKESGLTMSDIFRRAVEEFLNKRD